jgi:hypothetical protein
LEVTVTVVTHTTLTGVFVIVKLLSAVVEDLDSLKKFAVEPSGAAFTSIVTPCEGIEDVMETVRGKVVCGTAGWVEFAGGFNVTARLASVPPPPPPPLSEQLHIENIIASTINISNTLFFIKNRF